MIQLRVKGDSDTAFISAKARVIPVGDYDVKYDPTGETQIETTLYVDDEHETKVARWYSEPGSPPFPPGTLLHYSGRG